MADERKFPAVTVALIGLNLAIAFAAQFAPTFATDAAFDPLRPSILSAFSCLFAHSGLLHLLANMVFLAAVGPLTEFSRGGWRLAVLYILSGLAGVGAHWVGARASGDPSLLMGASGAIAGCVGFCSVRFARVRVPVFPRIGAPVGVIAIVWVLLQASGLVLHLGDVSRSGTAYWAHLGGFLAGIVLAFPLGGLREAREQYGHELLEKMNSRGPAATVVAADALLQRSPDNRDALWKKAIAHADLGEMDESVETIKLLLLQEGADEIRAVEHLIRIERLGALDPVARLKLADRIGAASNEVTHALLRSVADSNDPRRPEALLALAQLYGPEGGDSFADLIEQLEHDFPLHPATEVARQKGWLK